MGKVRYPGVSDTPAWKIVEANVTARFRGRSAFVGLQIEYSLLDGIARSHESTVARVALSWVQAQPGVTSTIIGA